MVAGHPTHTEGMFIHYEAPRHRHSVEPRASSEHLLRCPVSWPLATCGCWARGTWPVQMGLRSGCKIHTDFKDLVRSDGHRMFHS